MAVAAKANIATEKIFFSRFIILVVLVTYSCKKQKYSAKVGKKILQTNDCSVTLTLFVTVLTLKRLRGLQFQHLVAVIHDGGTVGDEDNGLMMVGENVFQQLPLSVGVKG